MFGRFFAAAATVAAAALAFACSGTTSATPGGSSGGTSGGPGSSGGPAASADQINSCKASCDKMKFFGCNSAAEQAACYDQCNQATPDQIQLFDACAGTSICDPACRTNITPKPAPGAPPVTGTGATPSSCSTACDKLVTCSEIKVGDKSACVDACQKNAYQYQIDCVNSTACDKLVATCGGSTSSSSSGSSGGASSGGSSGGTDAASIASCQASCDQILFFSCFDATAQSACRTTCTTSTTPKRDTFTSCVNAGATQCPQAIACYDSFKN